MSVRNLRNYFHFGAVFAFVFLYFWCVPYIHMDNEFQCATSATLPQKKELNLSQKHSHMNEAQHKAQWYCYSFEKR